MLAAALVPNALGQDHGDHGSDPAGSDPRALELENETRSDPSGVLHAEIRRARADEAQWATARDVAGARAAGVLGSLGWSYAAGKGRGEFVSFDLDAESGRWRNFSVAPRALAEKVPWLAAIDAEPFTHAHGPIVTGPTLRLFCQEEAAVVHDAPSGPLTIRTAIASELRFTAAAGVRIEEASPRAFDLLRGAEHAHLFFTRGTAIVDSGTLIVTLPANETAQFRVHAGPGSEGVHDANAALALRQMHLEVHAFAATSGPLDFELSWGASATPLRVTPTLAEWNVSNDRGESMMARFVISGWTLPTVGAFVDGAAVARVGESASGVGPRSASYVSLVGGVVEAWLPISGGSGAHAVRFDEGAQPREETPLSVALAIPAALLAAFALRRR